MQKAWKPVITSVWSPDWVALWLRTVVWTLLAGNTRVGFEIFHYWLLRLSTAISPFFCCLHTLFWKHQRPMICSLFTDILKLTKYSNIKHWRVSLVAYLVSWISPFLTSSCHDKIFLSFTYCVTKIPKIFCKKVALNGWGSSLGNQWRSRMSQKENYYWIVSLPISLFI